MFPITVTPASVNLLIDGRMRTIDTSHPNHAAVRDAVKRYHGVLGTTAQAIVEDELRDLVNIQSFVARVTEGRVKIGDTKVTFDGKEMHGVLVARMLDMLTGGFDVRPLARFMERLQANPSEAARNELYEWLEAGNMPITPDGYFIAFKKVKNDYTSSYDGVTKNNIGTTVSMPREEVDPDRHNTCSVGLHFCSYAYLPSFGAGASSRVVILKIDPADVVAIPSDYSFTKGRAWKYDVVGEVPEDEAREFFKDTPVTDAYSSTYEQDAADIDADLGIDETDDGYDDGDSSDSWLDDEPEDDNDDFSPSTLDDEPMPDEGITVDYDFEPVATVVVSVTDDNGDGDADYVDEPQAERMVPRYPSKKKRRKTFEHHGQTFTRAELKKSLKKHGQRATARALGIPRSTLQDWAREIFTK